MVKQSPVKRAEFMKVWKKCQAAELKMVMKKIPYQQAKSLVHQIWRCHDVAKENLEKAQRMHYSRNKWEYLAKKRVLKQKLKSPIFTIGEDLVQGPTETVIAPTM